MCASSTVLPDETIVSKDTYIQKERRKGYKGGQENSESHKHVPLIKFKTLLYGSESATDLSPINLSTMNSAAIEKYSLIVLGLSKLIFYCSIKISTNHESFLSP